jgi:hypothetical protein
MTTSGPYTALETELQALAPRIAFAATPDIATAVATRIRDERATRPAAAERAVRRRAARRHTGVSWWPRLVAQAALAVAALATAVLIASPAARAAVASVFRKVPGIRVIIGAPKAAGPTGTAATVSAAAAASPSGSAGLPLAASPTLSPTAPSASSAAVPSVTPSGFATASASPAPPLSTDFGTPTTLAAAQKSVPFSVGMPSGLGAPDAVYVDQRVGRGMVTMRWNARADLPDAGGGIGALLTQFDTGDNPDFPYFLKSLSGTATFDDVQVNGGTGGWIEGGHQVEFAVPRADGVRQMVSSRLAANTLVWLQNGVTVRLETALSRDAALALAATIR